MGDNIFDRVNQFLHRKESGTTCRLFSPFRT